MRSIEDNYKLGRERWAGEEDGQGLTSSVLYIPIPTPPAGKLYTSHSLAPLPSLGVKTNLNVPARSTTKSVALYCREERQFEPRLPVGSMSQQTVSPSLAYLVAVGVPANGDGLGPTRDKARDVFADDWLSEHSSPKNVPNGSVRALPHFLQLELCEDRDIIDPPKSYLSTRKSPKPYRGPRSHPGGGRRV